MKMKKDFFPLGASHAPYTRAEAAPIGEWEQDFIQMKKCGLNTVSVFAAWDKIEKAPGKFDFHELDHVFQLAEKHDMKLSVAIGVHLGFSKYTPRWFMRDFHGNELTTVGGKKCLSGNYRQPCFEDPAYNQAAERYIRTLVRRFRDKTALLQWRVWGESNIYGYCSCAHHAELFRKYLKEKYKTIQNLNQHWGTEGPGGHRSFRELQIPAENLGTANSFTEMEDWYDFLDRSMAGTIRRVERWVKEEDPHTMTLGEYFGTARDNHAGDGQNMSLFAESHDALGLSLYSNQPEAWALRMDAASSLARFNGHDAWTIELQGGPAVFSWQFFNLPSWQKIAMRMWSCIAHQSKGIFFWTWRPRISEFESGEYGMTRLDGTITERTLHLAKEFKLVRKYASLLVNARRKAECAILFSRPAETLAALCRIDHQKLSLYKGSVTDAHELLWRHNIPADFIALEQIDRLSDYPVVILPFLFSVSKELAEALRQYVKNGGFLIADAMLGAKDHAGRCDRVMPGFGLASLFGFTEDERLDPNEGVLTVGRQVLHAPRVVQTLLVQKKTEVLGTFTGKPALTRFHYGKGTAIFAGTILFNRESWADHPENEDWLIGLLQQCGLRPPVSFLPAKPGIECVCMETPEKKKLILLLNHTAEKISGELQTGFAMSGIRDLRTRSMIPVRKRKNICSFHAEADPQQCILFQIE
jgi:beta-galactosidase